MFDLYSEYPYLEEVNEGIVKAVRAKWGTGSSKQKIQILDVGCGYGQLGGAIAKFGVEVHGIEAQNQAVRKARKRLTSVFRVDLTDLRSVKQGIERSRIGKKGFDGIVFSDVLEHVVDPLQVLRFYKGLLKPGGLLFVSLPNLVNWEQRFKIAGGHFDYQDTGVLDRTHLRFFTFRTAARLLREAGFRVERTDYTPYIVRAFLPLIKTILSGARAGNRTDGLTSSPLYHFYEKFIYPLEYWAGAWWRSMFAFRMIFVASVGSKKDGK